MYQGMVAVALVSFAKRMRWVDYPAFNVETAKAWLPLNVLFVSMLSSGFISLSFVSVPIVTIFKNMTNLLTATGDYFIYGQTVTYLTVSSILIMTLGAIMSAVHDLEFNFYGYCWMIANCVITCAYTLYMRFATTSIKLPKFGMVYYNNVLSVFILIPVVLFMGEHKVLLYDEEVMTPFFWVANTAAGFLGFYLNFASLWCVGSTSATTYAIIGSLNKIPLTIFGAVLFGSEVTKEGVIFISLGIAGGLLYAYAKLLEQGAIGDRVRGR
jgi:GDP-mannose transporter